MNDDKNNGVNARILRQSCSLLAIVPLSVLLLLITVPTTRAAEPALNGSSEQQTLRDAALATETSWSVPSIPGPRQNNSTDAASYSRRNPGALPERVNDFSCKPSPEHPNPVILVHGTNSTLYTDYSAIGPMLAENGMCAFGLDYGLQPGPDGEYAWGDPTVSADQVGQFVDQVLAATGAEQVDIVGFSQGANISRWWVNREGAERTHQWVGLASPTRGGTFYGVGTAALALTGGNTLPLLRVVSPALVTQLVGSPWLAELNSPEETVPGVRYSTISTRFDEMIQPFDTMAIRGPGARNLVVQDVCPVDLTGHMALPYDPTAQDLLLGELTGRPVVPRCQPVPLGEELVRTNLRKLSELFEPASTQFQPAPARP